MEVNVEAKKIDILREKKFGWRIGGIGEKRARIQIATDRNQMLNEFRNAAHAEPPDHLWCDFVADQISENGRMTGVHFHRVGNRARNFISGAAFAQKFNVFCPRQGNQHTNSGLGTGVKKPARGAVINANNVEPGYANLSQILRGLNFCSEVISRSVWFERTIGDALEKKFPLAFKEKFCDSADWLRWRKTHSAVP